MYVCVPMYMCMHVYVCVYACVYAHTQVHACVFINMYHLLANYSFCGLLAFKVDNK